MFIMAGNCEVWAATPPVLRSVYLVKFLQVRSGHVVWFLKGGGHYSNQSIYLPYY